MLDFGSATFEYEPYPIGLVKPVIDEAVYTRLVASYLAQELFEWKPEFGAKYSLSELNHPAQYRRFIDTTPDWRRFHAYVKGRDFVPGVLEFLERHQIDIGLRRYRIVSHKPARESSSVWNRLRRRAEISARFEFSMLGADGGHILPHTDAPQKLITLVFSMMAPGEWDPAWGGGTEVVVPSDRTRTYNHMNRSLALAEVDVLKTWEFSPNQCLVFVKTFNSWHAVSPMRGAGRRCARR